MSDVRNRAAMILLCAAQFMDVLGVTVAVIALPAIGTEFPADAGATQWVVSGYALLFGGFLISAGRIADRYGHRRVFVSGLIGFTLASLAGGLAPSMEVLVFARAAQGLAAAFMVPAAFALVLTLTEEGAERVRAVGLWTATAAVGGAAGFMLGGLLVQFAGWRSIFLFTVPICVVVLVLSRRLLPADVRPRSHGPVDGAGAVLATGGLLAAIYGLTSAAGGIRVVSLVVAGVLLAAFVLVERRAADPLLPRRLVRSARFGAALAVAFALTFATTPASVLGTAFFQEVQKLSASTAGLLFAPFSIGAVAGSWAGTRVLARAGHRWTAFAGFGIICAALAASAIAVGNGTTAVFSVALAFSGLGLGAASVAATNAGTAVVGEDDRGIASGLLNTAPQLGSAIGTAVVGALALRPDNLDLPAGYTIVLVIAVVGTLTTLGLGRSSAGRSESRSDRAASAKH